MKELSEKKKLKKAELRERVAKHLLTRGFSDSGIRALANAAGISDRMLVYYFGSKERLLGEVLDLIAGKFLIALENLIGPKELPAEELLSRVAEEVLSYEMRPLLLFWFEIVGFAVRSEQPYKQVAADLMAEWQNWFSLKLRVRDRDKAQELFALLEGKVLVSLLTGD